MRSGGKEPAIWVAGRKAQVGNLHKLGVRRIVENNVVNM